jgi:hypothetical protein
MNTVANLVYGNVSVEVNVVVDLPKEYNIEDFDIIFSYKKNIDLTNELDGETICVMKQCDDDLYKIIRSKRCAKRKKGEKIPAFKIIMYCPGSEQLEARLHKLYENKKIIVGQQKLFKLDDNDISLLKDYFTILRSENNRPKSGYFCCNKITKPKTNEKVYCNRTVDDVTKDFCDWCLTDLNEDTIIDELYPFLSLKKEEVYGAGESSNEEENNNKVSIVVKIPYSETKLLSEKKGSIVVGQISYPKSKLHTNETESSKEESFSDEYFEDNEQAPEESSEEEDSYSSEEESIKKKVKISHKIRNLMVKFGL